MDQPSLLPSGPSERWVSVSEAAALEGQAGRPINKSSISRFIARNPDLPVKRDGQGRVKEVDYGALVAARSESLSVMDSRATAAPLSVVAETPAPSPGSRKRALEEEKLALDLAERKGELLTRAAVTMALESIGAAFTQAFERRRRGLATDVAGTMDVRELELKLKAADQKLLDGLAKDLKRLAATLDGEPEQAAA